MADKIATRQAYGDALVELGEKYDNLVVLDADLSKSTMTVGFSKKFKDRFFNMGIAEQNMYGTAAGLAVSGKIVCASTFAMFAAGRAFEVIRNSIGYTKANVKICATHAGITVGEDGASHQVIEDLALMRSIPGMVVLNPADGISTKKLIHAALDYVGPVYVRLGRLATPVFYDEKKEVEIGKGVTLREGKDYTIIATGFMVNEALMAAQQLAEEGLEVRVIDMHTIKPLDQEIILKAARETKGIVTAEEHTIYGGLGSAVAEVLAQNYPTKMKIVGIEDRFGQSGKPLELTKEYGLTADNLVRTVKSL